MKFNMEDHTDQAGEGTEVVPSNSSRDVGEEFTFKRLMLSNWARYEQQFTTHSAAAITSTETSQYLKHAARSTLFRQLAERQEVLCKALMLPAEIMQGLLYAMMELERQAEQEGEHVE